MLCGRSVGFKVIVIRKKNEDIMYIHTYNEIGDRVFKSILFLFIISQDIQGFTRSVVSISQTEISFTTKALQ